MKRICSALLSAVLCLSLCAPALAATDISPSLTQEDVKEASAYFSTVREHLDAVRAIVKGEPPKSGEEFTAKLKEAQSHIEAVWTMPAPSSQSLDKLVKDLRFQAVLVLWENIDPYLPTEEGSGAIPFGSSGPKQRISWEPTENSDGSTVYTPSNKAPAFDLEKDWAAFTDEILLYAETQPDITNYFLELEGICAAGEALLAKAAPALAAEGAKSHPITPDPAEFSDAKDIQYWDAVASLTKLGVVSGKDDGSFDPAGNVTRAEAAKLIAVLMNGGSEPDVEAKEAPTFSDTKGHWAEAYIEYCAGRHIVNGWDGRFDPDGSITVVELYKMALTALGHDAEAYHLMGASWAAQTIERATKVNSHNGVRLSDGLVNAEEMDVYQPASREVTAQILYNALRYNCIVRAPDRINDNGEVTWAYTPTSDTLFQLRFDMDELPTVPPQPTV